MDRRQATSYSTSLDLPHLPTLSPWSTLSTHHHACNLLAADGTLATLVSEVVGNGPFHIVVPGTRFDRLSDQSQVEWYDGQLRVGHLTIGLQSGRPWNPRLPSLSSQTSFAPLLAHLTQMQNESALYSGTPALTERAQRGIGSLQAGVIKRDFQLIEQGITLLAGLGPGLTPAGDDFLLGFLAALAVLPEQSNTGQDLRHLIVRCASPRTTRLSAAWLYHAGQSQFGELWHELINALNHDHHIAVQQAADAIATTGATSGVDALCGFRAGIEIVRSTPTSRFTPPATPHSA